VFQRLTSAPNFLRERTHRIALKCRALALIVSTALFTISACFAQENQILDLNVAQALIAEGKADQAFQMLEPFEAEFAGELQFDYLLGRSALESGRPSLASFIYERILLVEPDYVGVRLENGRAYMEMENYARARQEFDLLLRFDNLPPDLRSAAEEYSRLVDEQLNPRRFFYNVFAEYGFGIDDNVTGLQPSSILNLPGGGRFQFNDPLASKAEDFIHNVSAGGQAIYQLTDNWQLHSGIDYAGKFHTQPKSLDSHDANIRAGAGYVTRNSNLRLFGRSGWLYQNDDHAREFLGLSSDYLYAVDERNQLSAGLAYNNFRFVKTADQVSDFDSYTGNVGWNLAFWDGKALASSTLTGTYEDEQGGRVDGNKVSGGLSMALQASLTDSVGAFAVGAVQRDVYQKRNETFLVRRHETIYSTVGGVSWQFAKHMSLRPQITYVYSDSNVQTSDYDQLSATLTFRVDL
jgi:tetratricopeptide (TPR) repeat protein